MNLGPIGNLTPPHQASDADGAKVAEQRKAAQQFEAIFLRQLLGSLEKAGGFGGSDSGSAIFGSMMVGALADSAAASGGIGLADIIFQAMMPPTPPGSPNVGSGPPSAAPAGAATPAAPSADAGATPQLLPALPGGS
jgi:flagellar protein FlgJ